MYGTNTSEYNTSQNAINNKGSFGNLNPLHIVMKMLKITFRFANSTRNQLMFLPYATL